MRAISHIQHFNFCDFENVDLSNNIINYPCHIEGCNFKNTGIDIAINRHDITMRGSNFSGLNLSKYKVGENFFHQLRVFNCNFSDTKLRIEMTPIPENIQAAYNLLKNNNLNVLEQKKLEEKIKYYEQTLILEKEIIEQIKKGNLNGCFVNGVEILSLEQRKANAWRQRNVYENYKNQLMNSILSSIDDEIAKL